MQDPIAGRSGAEEALAPYEIRGDQNARPFLRVVDLVQQVLGVPMAAIVLTDTDTHWIKAARGAPPSELRGIAPFAMHTIARNGPFAVTDLRQDSRFAASEMVTGPLHVLSFLGVPLVTPQGVTLGTLCAFDSELRQFDRIQGEIMKKLGEIAVDQLQAQHLARQDAMTGAFSRSGFFAELEKEFQRATRYERPSSLVLIDIDRFGAINDRYGHAVGDAVLVAVANICMASSRRSDLLGRIGGEEFALLLPETDAADARDAADRIRRQIESAIIQAGGIEVRTTVSMGVAPIPSLAEGSAGWLNEADIALYEARQFGRNRVVVARTRRRTLRPAPDEAPEPLQMH